MPMSDGRNVLKKIAFQVGNKFFRFALNPENMTYVRPHRTTVLKTKSRIIVEDFQSDIPTYTISGTTGFNPTGKASDRGITKIKEMKAFLEDYAETGGNGRTAAEDFYFHNFTNDESFVVHLSPEGVTYTQDVNAPLMYRYEIKFVILRKSTDPADDDVVQPEIGNRYPTVNPGGGSSGLPNVTPPGGSVWIPSPILPPLGGAIGMPTPIIPGGGSNSGSGSGGNKGNGGYDPSSGNDGIYNKGDDNIYIPGTGRNPVNPQSPSPLSYQYGMSGLGFNIGYYGRWY
ncbi:virion structural protein [Bacillus phage TsarBomba]|uniref:Uncharacterized protein n=1 Tax=Bacillus phage TsarBomba TaxID=1690456 RepID=A0A0K2D0B2_9CAUD|nr:virion structural protein [Bacillus phage TsarBomba]ALA13031.1 hypothetical protein TSARBOMBA_102 [Bacillus phage TsarBomba]